MHKQQSARDVALDILIKWEIEEAYSNLLLNQQLRKSKLDERDKRLVTELVYGTIQRLHTLDVIIGRLIKKGKLDNWVKQLLRISLYQLLYLDKIPARAALYEAVELAKRRGNLGIGKFINGVLRSFLRRREELVPERQPKTIKERTFVYSFPEWMVKRLIEMYGTETADQVMQACNQAPKVSVRVNTLKFTRDELITKWKQSEHISISPSEVSEDGIILSGIGNAANHPWFKEGYFTVQDESSMLVAQLLDPKPGMHILDACAAPGGKTTHLAERMENKGHILACDIHPHKVELIDANAKRLGINMITSKVMDARKLEDEQYDAILLDAPCSGLGVITRKPDIKWRKTEAEIRELANLQQELLDVVATKIKPGGVLIYSTCTWDQEENKQQVERFLERNSQFQIDPDFQMLIPPKVMEKAIVGEGWIQLLPHQFHSDGFFIARMLRK